MKIKYEELEILVTVFVDSNRFTTKTNCLEDITEKTVTTLLKMSDTGCVGILLENARKTRSTGITAYSWDEVKNFFDDVVVR